MDEIDGLDALDGQIAALEQSLGGAQAVAAAFDGELRRLGSAMAETGGGMGRLSTGFSRGLRQSFDGLVLDGRKLSDVLGNLAQSMLRATYSAATRPVTDSLGGLIATGVESFVSGALPFANGAGFTQGRVMPFAHGGIVSGPVRLRGLRHRLLLDCVDPAEPAHRLLVERDGFQPIGTQPILGRQRVEAAGDAVAQLVKEVGCQFAALAFVIGLRRLCVVRRPQPTGNMTWQSAARS